MAKNGRDVKMEGAAALRGASDEFAKGIVGKPSETDSIRKEEEVGLGETTLLYGGGFFERESAGLEDGVSVRETVNPDEAEPNYDYEVDEFTGNATERKEGRTNNYSVTGKRGNKFSVGEM